ncbi:MAG: sialidase family protein, partial [Planctomycetota bacterium]
LRYPCWNPVLYQPPGRKPLMLFLKVGPNPREWWGEFMLSYDGGRSFRDRHRLPVTIDGPVRSKPLLLADGTLLCPSSTEHDHDWRMHFERLIDPDRPERGESWQRFEPVRQAFQVIQPTLIRNDKQGIRALLRSKHGQIMQTVSVDDGQTWTELEPTKLPNPNSGIEALTLADGRHLLVYNRHAGDRKDGWGSRRNLTLAASLDGKQWNDLAVLEELKQGELSYPAMIQSSDGMVHITYTWKRERVRHVVIDPSQLAFPSSGR